MLPTIRRYVICGGGYLTFGQWALICWKITMGHSAVSSMRRRILFPEKRHKNLLDIFDMNATAPATLYSALGKLYPRRQRQNENPMKGRHPVFVGAKIV